MGGFIFLVGVGLFSWVVCKLMALGGDANQVENFAPNAVMTAQDSTGFDPGRRTTAIEDDFLEPPVSDVMNVDTWQTNDVINLRYLSEE